MRSFAALRLQFATYKKIIGLIISGALTNHFRDILLVLGWSLASVIGHFAGLGLIFIYARSLENNTPIDLHGLFSLTASLRDLAVVAASVLCCMILSAFFQFLASRRSIELVCSYEEYLFRKAVSEASRVPIYGIGNPNGLCGDRLRIRAIRDARSCSQILSQLISNFTHLLFLAAFTVFAFWINWVATAAILVVFVLYGALLYKVNVRGASSSLILERLDIPSTREKLNIIDRFKSTLDFIPEDDPELEYIFKKGVTRNYFGAYRQRRLLASETQLLSGVFGAFIICGVLFLLGMNIFFYGGSWSKVLTYLIVLRFLLSRLMSVAGGLTSISRLYPNAKRFFETEFDNELSGPSAPQLMNDEKGLNLPSLHTEGGFIELRPGVPVAIISPEPLNRGLVGSLLSLMTQGAKGRATLIMPPVMTDRRALRSVVGINRKDSITTIEKDLFELGFEEEYRKNFPRGMKTRICEVAPDTPKKLFVLLALLAARHKGIPLVFIDGNPLSDLKYRLGERVLALCSDQVLFARFSGNKVPLNFFKDGIVVQDNKPVGWAKAEWLASHPEVLYEERVTNRGQHVDFEMENGETGY
jgi:hypothetical protein